MKIGVFIFGDSYSTHILKFDLRRLKSKKGNITHRKFHTLGFMNCQNIHGVSIIFYVDF